jgi:signal transduction histidine kinase
MDIRKRSEESERLIALKNQLKEVIEEAKELKIPSQYYEGIENVLDLKKYIIDLGICEIRVKKKFEEFERVCLAIAQSDFQKMEIDFDDDQDLFTHIGNSINTISTELEHTTTKKHYLEEIMDWMPSPAIITNREHVVLFGNKYASAILNLSKENLIQLRIANIFETQTPFGTPDYLNSIESEVTFNTFIIPYQQSPIKVKLYVKKFMNPNNESDDGYLYVFSRIWE